MNSLSYILQLIGWVLLQGILLNNMNLFGYANPALYLLFFMTYPAVADRALLLLLAALSGLAIDALSNTSGLYSCATLCVVFLRPLLIRLFFGQSFEDQPVNLLQVSSTLRVLYVLSFANLSSDFLSIRYLPVAAMALLLEKDLDQCSLYYHCLSISSTACLKS